MAHKISLLNKVSETDSGPRIGGKALLPEDIAWPKNPNSEFLVLIASLPTAFLNKELGLSLPENSFVSIFTTYSKNDYFLDVITYNGLDDELANIQNGFTRVITHQIGEARSESEYTIEARKLDLSPLASDAGDYTGSKLGGSPGWLQQEVKSIYNYTYILQLYSSDFPEGFEDIFYLTDAVGYLFLASKAVIDKDKSGLFFVQNT